ncbi:MAG: serine--tRNA ligase [Clostridia bacterium]
MLSLDYIRNNTAKVQEMLDKRNDNIDLKKLLELDAQYRAELLKLETLLASKNAISKKPTPEEIAKMKAVKQEIAELQVVVQQIKEDRDYLLHRMPNMLDERVPVGADDKDNLSIKTFGEKRTFDFEPKWHDEIARSLGILNTDAGAKVAGAGFLYWRGDGARLLTAIMNFALDTLIERGYTQMFTPILAKPDTFFGTGYLPFAEDQLYTVSADNKSLIGTSEQTLLSYEQNNVVDLSNGAILYTAWTPCFRTEAGAYGKETRGVFRVHQFNKVEQIVICKPEESERYHQFCLENEEYLLQQFGIPYRIVNVCTGDLGAPAAIKYDIEGWFPAYGDYRELTSNSNLWEYQARRLNIKYLNENGGKNEFVHTISATAITERAMLAILENNQNADGSVNIPKCLQKYMGGQTVIRKK